METITIYLSPDYIKDKVLTIKILSTLDERYKPEEIERDKFSIYMTNEDLNRVAVHVSFNTFYSLTRFCQISK